MGFCKKVPTVGIIVSNDWPKDNYDPITKAIDGLVKKYNKELLFLIGRSNLEGIFIDHFEVGEISYAQMTIDCVVNEYEDMGSLRNLPVIGHKAIVDWADHLLLYHCNERSFNGLATYATKKKIGLTEKVHGAK